MVFITRYCTVVHTSHCVDYASCGVARAQAGNLDVSHVYVPHDGKVAWTAGILSHVFAPSIVNNAIEGKHLNWSILYFFLTALPYLLKRLGFFPWQLPPPAVAVDGPVLCSRCQSEIKTLTPASTAAIVASAP
jgi:hypothetical protein